MNKKICNFNGMPILNIDNPDYNNKLIRSELSFDKIKFQKEFDSGFVKLNCDKKTSFNLIMQAIYDPNYKGEMVFFIDGPGG